MTEGRNHIPTTRSGTDVELVIKNAHVLDPSGNLDGVMDVRVAGGRIAEVGENLAGGREIAADGLHLFPGFVDVHAHWRSPGQEHRESIESGSGAAAAGGFTGVVMMPNTDPVVDRPVVVSGLVRRAGRESRVRAYVSAALHVGLAGERLTEMKLLKEAGALCVSDDGLGTQRASVLRSGMLYARSAGLPVILHCEDHTLATGVVHEGRHSALTGLPGTPASAEDVATAAGLILAAETGAKVHITHVSTGLSAALVGFFKKLGIADVTSDTTPHHLTLTDELVATLEGLYRVNPPLRPKKDLNAVREALSDGTFDFVATDHAPHASHEKDLPLEEANPGFLGHETAFAAIYTELVLSGRLSLRRLVEAMSCAPGRWVGEGGGLAVGGPADIALVDLTEEWTVERRTLLSKSENSPYRGRRLTGRVAGTIVGGEFVYNARDIAGVGFGVRA
ncbi:dihydroorotase [Rubrobacter indicoceani]|uniref:dihydroorotase n=1 Tax=Rubrobacter indicoceani TaxID=2051957 RepID=UPI000E5C3F39|nr:dihydroorotase [Rubrobacter indicoceani]